MSNSADNEAAAFPVLPTIEAIEKYGGSQAGYRRAHARGIVLRGTFEAAPQARALTVAEHFQGAAIPVQVRLSNAAANPFAPDRGSPSVGRTLGLSVRFVLPSGAAASWAGVNIPVFPAATPQDFLRITRAQKPFLSLAPNPFKIIAYILSRPSVLPAIKAIARLKPARSFGTTAYNGLHAYFLVNAKGERQAVRYSWQPRAGVETLAPADARRLPPLYLLQEIRERLAAGPVRWDLSFQLAAPGDPLTDASRAWPPARPTVPGGTLTVSGPVEDQRSVEALVFDPTGVVPGIELSDDPLLRFRAQVYSESYRRRSGETRAAPPPADMGQ
ncbi:MAG TPA: catalase family peroxidase [Polyangia bacterium]|nr:catalase family peroxidase [Polyangia bacterium]